MRYDKLEKHTYNFYITETKLSYNFNRIKNLRRKKGNKKNGNEFY